MESPISYLRPPAAGRAALKKLGSNYPDPVKWIHQEQRLNDRTCSKEYHSIQPTSVPPEFWPERQPVFWLPEFEAPKDQFRLFQNPARSVPWYLSGSRPEFYSYLVHPLTVQYFLDRDIEGARWKKPRFLATPMASHRTLLVWDPQSDTPPFAAKTSLNRWIGGQNRRVKLKEVGRSVGLSSLLAGRQADLKRQGILLLDDPVGLMPKRTNFGLLARDLPWRLGAGEEIVPVFSLLASPRGRNPRIVDLIAASRLGPMAWVDKFILTPLVYQAYFLGMTEGLLAEMHEQNVLMELRDGVPTRRFWHRDLGGFVFDRELRRLADKGLELPKGVQQRHLGRGLAVFHPVLRTYLRGSMCYAISEVLRKHFEVPADSLAELYDVRVGEVQKLILSATGMRTTKSYEKDLERYRKRKRPGFTWRWKSLREALRDW
ncbi:MAG TPA: hypothetical protein VFS60_17250 [Thermoanaerobaculia bacterium]|nr:hypothetical protein [Thermoanaerobaculia bacterium]